MKPHFAIDAEDVDFVPSADERELLDPAVRLAQAIDAARGGSQIPAAAAGHFVDTLAGLGLGETLTNLKGTGIAPTGLLADIAATVAKADAAIAWHGLLDLPLQLLIHPLGYPATWPSESPPLLAVPIGSGTSGPRWLVIGTAAQPRPAYWLWHPQRGAFVGPLMLTEHPAGLELRVPESLLGFAGLQATTVLGNAPALPAELPRFTAPPDTGGRLAAILFALYGGLLLGCVHRLTHEAYAYARIRESFGKPINQHQAVALRLADLALNFEAVRLTVEATTRLGHGVPPPGTARHVAELATRVARDAVQVAGAYGYVDGLLFRRLFEQTRTLATLLQQCGQETPAP